MTNYQKGARKERKFVNEARARGHVSFRSAGSHSPIDVIDIDFENRLILLIQCKPDSYPESQTNKLLQDNKHLNGAYFVEFLVK